MVNRLCALAVVVSVLCSSPALAEAPPHAAYGPMFVGARDVIRVDLDTSLNVFAVDSYNFELYKRGKSFHYFGGQAKRSPVFLNPPVGSYYVIIDNGGDDLGYSRAGVRVIRNGR